MTPYARTVEHVGEWAVTLGGRSREELFVELARVVARAAGRARGEPGPWEHVVVRSPDAAALLADWANELIGRSEVEQRAYADVRALTIDEPTDAAGGGGCRLTADIRGLPVSEWRSAVKAATYHGAVVEGRDDRWRARILFDV